ncbi:AlpA family transcriptional regulator [Variovorax sp. Sphag1AA]|uniref:helix-turn-helix transcriptional regulator n=1 Tax=Variovorax sp. Sphag1AA TaxID=2587027 RepID=UPI0016213DA2|nr:helix-turn-helix domain-containing protein [Variovorax sp. Sphag1AA]MBB3182271.1 putative DNA-binding transcriptional regulator AlpA [Variovorax sp. Sphag1AA]
MSKVIPSSTALAAELLDKVSVCNRLSLSLRTLENMVQEGTFPPPVRVGRRVYWSEIAVRRWQQRLFAAQESWQPH